jgi:isopenicillin-N N-acyltransferase-like protein
MDLPLPLVAVSGTPRDCGVAYGTQAAELIAANTAKYLERFSSQAGLSPDRVRAAGAGFRTMTHERLPRIAELLDGVADGSGVAAEEIYALNARTELLYGTSIEECTAIGVLDTRSASGDTLLAQNWDWHPDQRPYTLLLATRDETGFVTATLTEAGMLAKSGLNSAGLGVCVNMLGSDRDGRPGGVPYHVLLRAVLEAPTLHHAIVAACANPRSASINLLIGQAFDDESTPGEIVDLEVAPGDVGFVHPVDGLITHANHFESGLPLRDTLKDFGGTSFFRAARARRLLGDGMLNQKNLAEVLGDHGGNPRGICRHDDPNDGIADRSETLYSVLLNLDERSIAVAAGPPCGTESYRELRIKDIFRKR